MAKNLKLKPESQKISFRVINDLLRIAPSLRCNTYADFQRMQTLLEQLNEAYKQVFKLVQDFKKENKLPETEELDANHPLFADLNNKISNAFSALKKQDITVFNKEDFAAAIQNLNLLYADISFLDYWLVKK